MNDFWKNLAALLKVKTIVMTVVIMVISFYFGSQNEKNNK